MREQITNRYLRGRIGFGEREIRIEIADARVPFHDAIADQRCHDGGGQRLGNRGQLEDRVGRHRLGLPSLASTEAFEENDLVAIDDADR